MRLYTTQTGKWAGTQADARQLAKEENSAWQQFDVPTDKDGLLEFLNKYGVADASPLTPKPVAVSIPDPVNVRPVAGTAMQPRDFTPDQIEEFILDRASVAQVERIFAAIGTRFAEQRKVRAA